MTAKPCRVILDRQWRGQRECGWRVTVEPDPGDGEPIGGTWPDYQDAALYASRLSRARGWPLIRRGEARQAHGG